MLDRMKVGIEDEMIGLTFKSVINCRLHGLLNHTTSKIGFTITGSEGGTTRISQRIKPSNSARVPSPRTSSPIWISEVTSGIRSQGPVRLAVRVQPMEKIRATKREIRNACFFFILVQFVRLEVSFSGEVEIPFLLQSHHDHRHRQYQS